MEEIKHKFYLTASIIKIEQETPELKKEAASVIKLPNVVEQQPDLGYFSAILVSTGTNLNGAHFLGSELVKAANTVTSKALDYEHQETEILGHIYSSVFTTEDHQPLDLVELASIETASLDSSNMHIEIGCVIYKARFPELYKDIKDNKYCVSMECYYSDFDIKVGNTIIPKATAASLGVDITDDSIYGRSTILVKDGKEIAAGKLVRVLRGICFSGVGIVENPANPASVILEAAAVHVDNTLIIDMSEAASNNVTSKEVETTLITANVDTVDVNENNVLVSDNGDHAGLDHAVLLPLVERVVTECVDTYLQRKSSFEEGSSKLERLRNALNRTKTI